VHKKQCKFIYHTDLHDFFKNKLDIAKILSNNNLINSEKISGGIREVIAN